MNNKIGRRLRIRFVFLSVFALLILQSLIVGISIAMNYRQISIGSDRAIMEIDSGKTSDETDVFGYFRTTYDITTGTTEIDAVNTSLISRTQAIALTKKIVTEKKDKGFEGDFRYLVHREKNTITIVFLSRSATLNAWRNNSTILIIVSFAGIAATAIILSLLSPFVVKPIISNRLKQKEFITSASHELKTPLTVISADSQILEAEIGTNEWLSDIMKQTARMTEMTHRLVYLAKAEEVGENTVKIEFPVSDVTEEIADEYNGVASHDEKVYNINICSGITYRGDEKAIKELITALLDNAFKYGTKRGFVSVNLSRDGKGIKFYVENSVADIDSSEISRFTERFYRADSADKTKGFGIGLSIAKAVAEAHDGKLTVELTTPQTIRFSATLK